MNFPSCLLEAHVPIPIYTVGGVTLACQQIYSLRFELGSYEEHGFGALLAAVSRLARLSRRTVLHCAVFLL